MLSPLLLVAGDTAISKELLSLLVIALIAAAAPLVLGLLRLRLAEVVVFLAAGVVFGPHGLHWIVIDDAIELLAELGLGFLFFAAGLELEQAAIRGRSGRLAAIGWFCSALAAMAAAGTLQLVGLIDDFTGIAIALTSTALGTLLPILRDWGELRSSFGRYFMGAGAMGEFGPILAISLLLGASNTAVAVLSLLMFAAAALILARLPLHLANDRMVQVVQLGHHTSSQTALRLTILLLVALLVIANRFGLDAVLGAFVAGVILRRYLPEEQETLLALKVEGVAFGIFVPIFFIVSGANLDIASIIEKPLRMGIFFVLMLLVRGLPQFFLYRSAIPDPIERSRFALLVATALPIIVAVTTLELRAGLMRPENAAALVGAGALSVLVFPMVAAMLPHRSSA
ncbi:MAG: cation:proton antiporter [Cyanobacteria bacterium]|nr:cation:proton antiporter [Cyanobacteriota bacterium]